MDWRANSRIYGSYAVADPDLQIRWRGGGGRSSRPLGKGGGGLKKCFFFRSLGSQFGLKIRGRGAPRPLPWIRHCYVKMGIFYLHGNRTRIRIVWTLVLSPVIILK